MGEVITDHDPGDETQVIRAWMVWSPFREDDDLRMDGGLVFAPSGIEAIAIYARDARLEQGDLGEYEDNEVRDLKVESVRGVVADGEPRVITDPGILRQAGWRYEGESACVSCGCAANGMEEYKVCLDCDMCMECGHDDFEGRPCPEEEGYSCG